MGVTGLEPVTSSLSSWIGAMNSAESLLKPAFQSGVFIPSL